MSKEYDEGYEAYAELSISAKNPYNPNTKEYDSWLDGFNEAREDRHEYLDSISPLRPEDYG